MLVSVVEVEEDQGSIKLRKFGDRGVKLVEPTVIPGWDGEVRELDEGTTGAGPVECSIQRDAVDEGLGFRFRTIVGQRFPEGDEEVLV